MAVRIKESELRLTRRVEDRSVDATASGTLRLPSELPDAASVVRWRALASVERLTPDPASGRVEAQGRVRVWVVYVAAGSEAPDPVGAVYGGRMDGELSYSAWLEIPPEGEAAAWQVDVTVRDVEGRFRPDGRSADVDVVLGVHFTGVASEQNRVVTQVLASPPDRVDVSTANLRLKVVQGWATARINVEDARPLDVPGGGDRPLRVLDLRVQPLITGVEVRPGEAVVKGQLSYELLYAYQHQPAAQGNDLDAGAPAEPAQEQAADGSGPAERQAPARAWHVDLASWPGQEGFESTLAIDGIGQGSQVKAQAFVTDASVRILGSEGVVSVSAQVEVRATATASQLVPVVAAIRADAASVEQRTVAVRVEAPAGEGRRTFTASTTVELPGGLPPIERIVWSGVGVDTITARPEPGRVHVSATATPWIYYLPYKAEPQSQGLHFASWPGALSIEQVLAIPDLRPEAEVRAQAGSMTAEVDLISRQTLEFTVSGTCQAEAETPVTQDVVAEAVLVRPSGNEPDPFIYLVVTQAGDTLWKLSRRYRTATQQILAANPDLEAYEETAPLPAGTRLFILRGA